jgi:ADP-heptose:LPS heptosyltransferase
MLREYLPRVEWTYAVSPGSAEVLERNPHVAEVLPIIRGENSWDLVDGGFGELASRAFDVVLCSNTLRHHPDLALATALGIPNRFAFEGKGFSGLINYPVAMGFPDSYASYFRTMVAAAIDRPADWELRPRLHPSADDERRAGELFTGLGVTRDKPVMACSLGTRQARGNWPEEVLLAIVDSARSRLEFDIVLTGIESEAARLKAIASGFRFPVSVLAGNARLLTFAAFLKRCNALLTIDSGPRHIGNAMGLPVYFARNLSHSMHEAGAYCETETDLAPPVEYLDEAETARVARAQPIGLLADKLLGSLSVSGKRE